MSFAMSAPLIIDDHDGFNPTFLYNKISTYCDYFVSGYANEYIFAFGAEKTIMYTKNKKCKVDPEARAFIPYALAAKHPVVVVEYQHKKSRIKNITKCLDKKIFNVPKIIIKAKNRKDLIGVVLEILSRYFNAKVVYIDDDPGNLMLASSQLGSNLLFFNYTRYSKKNNTFNTLNSLYQYI